MCRFDDYTTTRLRWQSPNKSFYSTCTLPRPFYLLSSRHCTSSISEYTTKMHLSHPGQMFFASRFYEKWNVRLYSQNESPVSPLVTKYRAKWNVRYWQLLTGWFFCERDVTKCAQYFLNISILLPHFSAFYSTFT